MANTHPLKKLYGQSAVLTLLGISSSKLLASTLNITAAFTPDPTNPNINTFENTTPVSGFCAQFPIECRRGQTFSLLTPIDLVSREGITAHHEPDDGPTVTIPWNWREVEMVSTNTGQVQKVEIKITGFGGTHRLPEGAGQLTGIGDWISAHRALWGGGSWYSPVGPCRSAGNPNYQNHWVAYFWLASAETACRKTAAFNIQQFSIDTTSMAYELRTPNPLDMESETYTGSFDYSIGSGKDFDVGNNLVPSIDVLTLNFTLTVNHVLHVKFPPGANRLALIPAGGWQQWLIRGRVPEKLSANQDFQFWASTRFTMQLQCQYEIGDQCGIQNTDGHQVPVATSVTLPSGITSLDANTPANRYPLRHSTPSRFRTDRFVDTARSTLHFDVDREGIAQMTEHAGSQYSGDFTIIWDSQT